MNYLSQYNSYDMSGRDMILIHKNKKEETIKKTSAFYDKAMKQINSGKTEISVIICSRMWKCTVAESNNKYLLIEHD